MKKSNEDVSENDEFLKQFQILSDQYLQSLEKTLPPWETRTIPITFDAFNGFYNWVKQQKLKTNEKI